jgi:hypothetical protein
VPSRLDQLRAARSAWFERRAEEVTLEVQRRLKRLARIGADADRRATVLEMCKRDVALFISDWVWTFDPRNIGTKLPTMLPFVLRPRQRECLEWLEERVLLQEDGVVEKSRDEGASWLFAAWSVHRWLFTTGFTAGFGSRKLELVDNKEDPKAIFPKIRHILRNLPRWMLPKDFDEETHAPYCRVINSVNGSSITGEGGTNIGRGGRTSVYFVDEYAFLESQLTADSALSNNTRTCIRLSSVNGVGNAFYQRCTDASQPKFVFDWHDNPDKNELVTLELEDGKTEQVHWWYELETLRIANAAIVAQEIDRDPTASANNIVIPALWVQAARKLRLSRGGQRQAGLDVSDPGTPRGDKTTYAARAGGALFDLAVLAGLSVSDDVEERATRDGVLDLCYDRMGVGASITATMVKAQETLPFTVIGVANGETPTKTRYEDRPELTGEERFTNLAAELWWRLRLRFQATWERLELGTSHPDDECISLADLEGHPQLPTLVAQLSQPVWNKTGRADKIHVDKKGNGISSPDHAEAVMYAYAPADALKPAAPPRYPGSNTGRPRVSSGRRF